MFTHSSTEWSYYRINTAVYRIYSFKTIYFTHLSWEYDHFVLIFFYCRFIENQFWSLFRRRCLANSDRRWCPSVTEQSEWPIDTVASSHMHIHDSLLGHVHAWWTWCQYVKITFHIKSVLYIKHLGKFSKFITSCDLTKNKFHANQDFIRITTIPLSLLLHLYFHHKWL